MMLPAIGRSALLRRVVVSGAVQLGVLHLEALRKYGNLSHSPDRALEHEPVDADYELLDEAEPEALPAAEVEEPEDDILAGLM